MPTSPVRVLRPLNDMVEEGNAMGDDMVVDAAGNAYVGSFGFDLHAGAHVAGSLLTLIRPMANGSRSASRCCSPTAW